MKQANFKVMDVIYKIVTDGNRSEAVITRKGESEPLKEIELDPEPEILQTNLNIELRGNDGSLLADAQFNVYRDGLFMGTYRTDNLGRARMRAILPGSYKISQFSSAGGFLPDQTEKNIEISLGESKQLPVVNYKPESGGNTESDADNGNSSEPSSATAGSAKVKAAMLVPAIAIPADAAAAEDSSPTLDKLPKTGGMTVEFGLIVMGCVFMGFGVFLSAGNGKKGRKKIKGSTGRTEEDSEGTGGAGSGSRA